MKRLLPVLLLLLAGCGIQPSDPITGTQVTGTMIYLVQRDSPVPVLRQSRRHVSPSDALSLLAEELTPVERDAGFTNEVPSTAGPITITASVITVNVDPFSLSPLAVAQIACTAAIPGPVTLTDGEQVRGSVTCPV